MTWTPKTVVGAFALPGQMPHRLRDGQTINIVGKFGATTGKLPRKYVMACTRTSESIPSGFYPIKFVTVEHPKSTTNPTHHISHADEADLVAVLICGGNRQVNSKLHRGGPQ